MARKQEEIFGGERGREEEREISRAATCLSTAPLPLLRATHGALYLVWHAVSPFQLSSSLRGAAAFGFLEG